MVVVALWGHILRACEERHVLGRWDTLAMAPDREEAVQADTAHQEAVEEAAGHEHGRNCRSMDGHLVVWVAHECARAGLRVLKVA